MMVASTLVNANVNTIVVVIHADVVTVTVAIYNMWKYILLRLIDIIHQVLGKWKNINGLAINYSLQGRTVC
jgi:hypothetical protein